MRPPVTRCPSPKEWLRDKRQCISVVSPARIGPRQAPGAITVNAYSRTVPTYSYRPLTFLAIALFGVACSADGVTAPDLDAALAPLTSSAIASGPFSDVLPDAPIVTSTDARNRALAIFPGATIVDVDLNDIERELAVAEVRLRPAGGGGAVKLHFSLANGRLAEAEGETPPFTYAFAPEGEFVSLAEAFAAATGSSGRPGTVTEWKLQLEDGSRWQYRVWVTATDRDWRVRVNAHTGSVSRVQER